MEEKINKIKILVKENYDSSVCGFTAERSAGNFDDCFDDGYVCGSSWLAHQIGKILEMDLEEPEIDDDCY
ncbi:MULTISPECIES: hypothetical protein [unclassified Clostridioides]|uniref:hypothetical protein n=1 Tax=unclassified Clostridioides TaxID=2635829 RepID=UPI001D108E97|nr:hypothetical protein [Clostridioides sp. ZZV14-6045]MCC0731182.1 hypothetical protein [Clostridioides sp. ZZV14-6048]MCC0735389.1 hypothetical protein [Clostridioides sp. ZZV14-6009]MCC0740439.1 hypothetical protein [Clostridioides sp. ZZV14-5902]